MIFRYFAIGAEETYGTAVAATLARDVESASLDSPGAGALLVPDRGLSRARRQVRAGFYAPAGDVSLPADFEIMKALFGYALGTVVEDAPEFVVTGTDETVLPSFTARIGRDLSEHVFAGCAVNTLTMEASDSFIKLTAGIKAQKDSLSTLKDLEALLALGLDAEPLTAFHELTCDAGYESARVRSLVLKIENGIDETRGRGVGSRFPYRLRVGARTVSVDLVLDFDSLDQFYGFWGNEQGPSADSPTEFAFTFTVTDRDGNEALFTLPRAYVAEGKHATAGRAPMDEAVTLNALQATDGDFAGSEIGISFIEAES
jgi:hypothetical protein